jgi:phage tail tape-measure protein
VDVGMSVGRLVGDAVGGLVGDAVGAEVGVAEGVAEGADVGPAVGCFVGTVVGSAVGANVFGTVKTCRTSTKRVPPAPTAKMYMNARGSLTAPQLIPTVLNWRVTVPLRAVRSTF